MPETILTIDDDRILVQLIEHCLRAAGYKVVTAPDGNEGLHLYRKLQPALVLLDLMMPKLSGWEVCRQIRAMADTPIIMLTARDDPTDVVKGLNLGADDYVKKPFHPAELQARVRAALRRAKAAHTPPVYGKIKLDRGRLIIDMAKRQVEVNGKIVSLTPREYGLLIAFVKNPGIVLTTHKIFEYVWSYDSEADVNNVKWYIWRLRKKIERNPRLPELILTERGIGYRFIEHSLV